MTQNLLKKKPILIIAALVAVVALGLWLFLGGSTTDNSAAIKTAAKKGRLDITVTTTGELEALNSEDIKGPFGLRMANIWQVKIADLIPEGSIVKAGDYIATLDRSEISGKMKDLAADLSKIESQYLQTKLDTALDMRKLRDDLVNLKFEMQEKKLTMEQSKYEPPAVIKQTEIDLQRAERAYDQAVKNYKLKLQQNKAKMQEIAATLSQQQSKMEQMDKVLSEFMVRAPKDGMLIYKKDWNGHKVKAGSTISAWDLTVATLPDLSTMISKTYVNEIDINKLRKDQSVEVRVDAFPDKKFKGKVISIANVGEQLPDNESKVFEVTIELLDKDTLLRPAMTTSNIIFTQSMNDVVYIPIDALQGDDSVTYVYKDKGGKPVKQEVVAGAMNANFVEVRAGVKEGEEVYMSTPTGADKLALVRLSAKEKPAPPKPVAQKKPDTPAVPKQQPMPAGFTIQIKE